MIMMMHVILLIIVSWKSWRARSHRLGIRTCLHARRSRWKSTSQRLECRSVDCLLCISGSSRCLIAKNY